MPRKTLGVMLFAAGLLATIAVVAGLPSLPTRPVASTADLKGGTAPYAPYTEMAQAPEALGVLWDQPSAAAGGWVDQIFPDSPGNSTYLADDFTNASPWTISSIVVPGFASGSVANATGLTWSIYADAAGLPGGYPGTGATPFWTLTLPPTDPQVSITTVAPSPGPGTVTLNLSTPFSLPAGSWWFEFVPNMNFGSFGQWFWMGASTANGAVAKLINPGGAFGWGTGWQNFTVIPGNSTHDCAFTLSGTTCSYPLTINMSALGGTTADWPVSHGTEANRLYRNGIASSCAAPKAACPGTSGVNFAYDAFSFTNQGPSACVTATLNTACTGTNYLFMTAYLGSFNPASICTNYLADNGSSGTSMAMSFTVPAGATFVLIVNEVTSGAGCATGYSVVVDGLTCGSTCPTINLSPAAGALPAGAIGVVYPSKYITASGGTTPYTYAVTSGALPPGLTFSATGLLSGKPTAVGLYSFTVTATDANLCTGSAAYTLRVGNYDVSFLDSTGRSSLCINTVNGNWKWNVLRGTGAGTSYTGKGTLQRGTDGYLFYSSPTQSYLVLKLQYFETGHFARGYFRYPAKAIVSDLYDPNTLDNTMACP